MDEDAGMEEAEKVDKKEECRRFVKGLTFDRLFGFAPKLSESEVQTFVHNKLFYLEPVGDHRCRMRTKPKATLMLIKNGEHWHFVKGDNARFSEDDLKSRSACTKAWGYHGIIPPFITVRDRTKVYNLSCGVFEGGDENTFCGACLIITDPPLLPIPASIYLTQSQPRFVTHDLESPWAMQYAPEFQGCPVNQVDFIYAFKGGHERSFPDLPRGLVMGTVDINGIVSPLWKSLSVSDQYYLIGSLLQLPDPKF